MARSSSGTSPARSSGRNSTTASRRRSSSRKPTAGPSSALTPKSRLTATASSPTTNTGSKNKSLVHIFFESFWGTVVDFLGFNLGPGFIMIRMCHIVNAFKGATLPFCIFLMHHFDNFSAPCLTYTALHGSYGVLWVLKEHWCPDRRFHERVPLGSALAAAVFCGLYWLAPVLLISKYEYRSAGTSTGTGYDYFNMFSGSITSAAYPIEVSPVRQAVCTFVYVIGVVMMLVADTHKFIALEMYYKGGSKMVDKHEVDHDTEINEKKKTAPLLIQDGIFSNNRNPNYLGEMLLYGSFAGLVPNSDIPKYVLAFAWGALFTVNIYKKESSLMRKPGYEAYAKRSWIILPKPKNFLLR
ncbi:unnamed protein product [Amoebophrya sp. A120]|nr:unnamed protein product [Amoebophrya sp. A120]|eukprot:GSA120T00009632001.1